MRDTKEKIEELEATNSYNNTLGFFAIAYALLELAEAIREKKEGE